MGILHTLRRRFPFESPHVFELPAHELEWGPVSARRLTLSAIQPPDVSNQLILCEPPVVNVDILRNGPIPHIEEAVALEPPEVVRLDAAVPRPSSDGGIYVRKQQELFPTGSPRVAPPVEPWRLRDRLDTKAPKGLSVFDLLLPVLMPPAKTEFRDDLLFPSELYPFQRAGVKWLFEMDTALLADDMGLGKTVQAITAFRALIRRGMALQALVVCPKSVLTNWMREIERWAPELVAMRIHGSPKERHLAWQAYVGKCHVLVTTYDTLKQDREWIKGRVFDLVVADEVQRIKNPGTAVSRSLRSLRTHRSWGLTGTPLENSVDDVVAVFGFIRPGLFARGTPGGLPPRIVRERIRPHLLRRRKDDALPGLPPKLEDTTWIDLTEAQRKAYEEAETAGVQRLKATPDATVQHVFALIQTLKQICNFDKRSGESAKMDFLLEDYLSSATADNDKVLIFSQYVDTLRRIAEQLKSYSPLLYTGALSEGQRNEVTQLFTTDDRYRVLLLSLRAGGVGLNLERANYVLHFDRWWNPAVERQAEDRTHRIGQSKSVFVTRLICQDTIEERIERKLQEKRRLFDIVIDELADEKLERVLSEEDLFGLFNLTPPQRSRMQPATAQAAPSSARGESLPAAVVITEHQPYSNVMNLRRLLREAAEYIWWVDLHFHARALEELIVTINPAAVHDVRILSGPANVDERAKRDFRRFKTELSNKGISAEWRVLPRFSHDRFIISRNWCYNVPPVNSLLSGSYSELLATPHRPPFAEWWLAGKPLEDA